MVARQVMVICCRYRIETCGCISLTSITACNAASGRQLGQHAAVCYCSHARCEGERAVRQRDQDAAASA